MSFRKPCHMPFRKLIPPFTLTDLNSCNSCNLVDSILPCVRSVIDDSRETSKRGKKKSNRHVSRKYSWVKKGVVPGKNLA